jgi:hypothetical protein
MMTFSLALTLLPLTGASLAAESGKSASLRHAVTSDNLQCGRFQMGSVADLKQKLLEYCDLSVPYSFSTNNPIGADTTVIYCCVKKQ